MFYGPAQDLQLPTHPRLHIRDVRDAQIVLEAVRLGVLRLVKRRLNEGERSIFIRPGAVFVWEESDEESGLKRWTDGRTWSQSRAREPFLFYEEKIFQKSTVNLARSHRTVESSPRGASRSMPPSRFPHPAGDPSGLIKQAYSAWMCIPGSTNRRKWHVTAYFTPAELNRLPTPGDDPGLRSVAIPSGVYRSCMARTRDPEPDVDMQPQPHNVPQPGPSSHRPSACHYSSPGPQASANYGGRLPEDQRVIQVLNSQHIM